MNQQQNKFGLPPKWFWDGRWFLDPLVEVCLCLV